MNKHFVKLLLGFVVFTACDDDTSIIGMGIMPEADNISTHNEIFPVKTSTIKVDSVLANTKTCYLGSIVDPELNVRTKSDFLAQFHLPENFKLPKLESMIKDNNGLVVADSCDIQIIFDKFYGDSLTTMKLDLQELSTDNILKESINYYTNIDPNKYINTTSGIKKSVTYTIKDLSLSDSKNNQKRILVRLPQKYATALLRSYYQHPEYFSNSYQFIHNVCPGFYFGSTGGVGSMIATKSISMNVYFRHSVKLTAEKDTIINGMQRFGATEEVIQCSSIDNDYPGSIIDNIISQNDCSFVKTPAALCTEMELPVASIVGGEHDNDSINLAQITIRKYNQTTDYSFDSPEYLLLVRKSSYQKFFEKRSLPDYKESFLSSKFNPGKNTYNFSNIGQLITLLKIERDCGAGILPSDDALQRSKKYVNWETENPDWNKILLIPVKASFIKATDYYGRPLDKLQGVQHELGITSAKLEGGKKKPLNIQVIYSRYNR